MIETDPRRQADGRAAAPGCADHERLEFGPGPFAEHAPTRGRQRIGLLSRTPRTGRLGEIWHVAAERAEGRRVTFDRAPDIDPQGPLTREYAAVAALVDDAAAWLWQAGVRPWDRVAVMKANHADVALLGCAAARIGAVPVQLAWTHDPPTTQALLSRLARPFLVTDQARLRQCGLDRAALGALTRRTVVVDGRQGRRDVVDLDDLRGAAPVGPRLRADDEPMVVTHTSGTTGVPKLVLHSATSNHALALVEAERWPFVGLRSRDRVAFADPFCHQRMSTAMAVVATLAPELLLIADPAAPGTGRLLVRHRPTVVETLPNVYLAWEALAGEPGEPFRDVRLFVNSFDAIHTRTIRTLLAATRHRLPVWVQSWSQSEAGAMVIRPYFRSSVRRIGVRPPSTQILGWPLPGLCKVRTTDPATGRDTPRGSVGLVQVSQPGRCLAYVGEQDRHDLKRDGEWWNTGDLGVRSRSGALRLIDREIDRIPGSSAIELEDVLLDRLPQTTEVVVLPDATGLPVPVVCTRDDEPLDRRAWLRAVADLPPLAEPVQLRWDQLPRTATWKVRRVQLRQRLLQDRPAHGVGRWT